MTTDYYAILGVERNASQANIVAAYRRMAMRWHPDRHQAHDAKAQAESKFKELQQAYSVLSDDRRRREYDASGGASRSTQGSDWWQHAAEAAARARRAREEAAAHQRAREEEERRQREEEARRRRAALPKGADIKKKISITLQEAVGGSTIRIVLPQMVPCTHCGGRGVGADNKSCRHCKGKGQEKGARAFSVRIPPGVGSGQKMVVRERGKPSRSGGLAGDVVLSVVVKATKGWSVKGLDLTAPLKVPFVTALLGGAVKVDLPTGRAIEVTVPPRTDSGKRLRVAGMGLRGRNDQVGDVELVVSVALPKSRRQLTAEQVRVLHELGE